MRHGIYSVAWLLLGLSWVGCSQQGDQAATAESTASTPEQTVFDFLEAVRRGNDEQAERLLTSTALRKTKERDMVVAPPGSDTASFTVDQAQLVGDDGAHVPSSWKDVDHDGEDRTDGITWVLRKEDEGWRIAGMATKVFPDQAAVVMNFEDPDDMLRKQQMVEQEMMRRADGQSLEARNTSGQDPFQTGPK